MVVEKNLKNLEIISRETKYKKTDWNAFSRLGMTCSSSCSAYQGNKQSQTTKPDIIDASYYCIPT